jgi:hypothetical protein
MRGGPRRMTKEKMTRKELAATILSYCIARNLDIRSVMVWPSQAFGWDASFVAADPALFFAYMTSFDNLLIELRATFDLVDEYAVPPKHDLN